MSPGPLSTRREALGTGLAAALATPAALLCWPDPARGEAPDADRLNLLLAVKRVAHKTYAQALRHSRLSADQRELVRVLEGQERVHVVALRRLVKARGATPPQRYRVEPPGTASILLEQALELERWEIGALTGVAEQLRSRESADRVANFAQVDARHATSLRLALGRDPLSEPFAEPLGEAEVRRRLALYREPEADEAEGR